MVQGAETDTEHNSKIAFRRKNKLQVLLMFVSFVHSKPITRWASSHDCCCASANSFQNISKRLKMNRCFWCSLHWAQGSSLGGTLKGESGCRVFLRNLMAVLETEQTCKRVLGSIFSQCCIERDETKIQQLSLLLVAPDLQIALQNRRWKPCRLQIIKAVTLSSQFYRPRWMCEKSATFRRCVELAGWLDDLGFRNQVTEGIATGQKCASKGTYLCLLSGDHPRCLHSK